MCKEINLIQDIASKVENSWTSYSAYLLRIKLKEIRNIIKKWYDSSNIPSDMEKILDDYADMECVFSQINYGYMYYLDELKKFLKNPISMWNAYDDSTDKSSWFREPFVRYSTNERKNTDMFLREVFYSMVENVDLLEISQEFLETLEESDKMILANALKKVYSNSLQKQYILNTKEQLAEALQNIMNTLNKLCSLEDMRKVHNDIAHKLNLTCFEVPDETLTLENGKILGVEFKDSSIFQLEAMLCHYFNRLEKVREGISNGLFLLYYLSGNENPFDFSINDITDVELLECQKKYIVLSTINNELCAEYHNLVVMAQEQGKDAPTFLDVYKCFFKRYQIPFSKVFNFDEVEEEFSLETTSQFGIGFLVLLRTNSYQKHYNYLAKANLMEDLIIQAEREKVNWGIMEDGDSGYRLKKNMLIGIDVPGLNMPLRVHYPLGLLKKIVYDYLKMAELPLYVGQEDFDIGGKLSGTQFLVPITQKQKKIVKLLAKIVMNGVNDKINVNLQKDNISSQKSNTIMTYDALMRVKHINYMQLSNTAERILAEKTNKSQTHLDYINIFTGKIRRTPRRNI